MAETAPGQIALRNDVRKWIATAIEPYADDWEREGAVPRELFTSFADSGLLAAAFPEELGGGGGSFLDQLTIADELYYAGWGGVALSLLGHAGIALQPFVAVGSPQQHRDVLAPALRGERIVGIAVSESQAGSDVASLQTTATAVPGGWRIQGRKVFITLGTQADVLLTAARTSPGTGTRGISLLAVDTSTPGFRVVRTLDKLGMRSSVTAEIAFDDCLVPHDALVGPEGAGFKAVMSQFQAERLILAMGALAMARRALDEGVAYLRAREQFGRPLAEFQALRHRVADAAASLEALTVFVRSTAERYAAGEYPVTEISMAKLLCARAAHDIVDEMLQMAGGWGYVSDLPFERLWRDVRLMRIGGGTDEIMRELIAREVFARSERGDVPPATGATTSERVEKQA